MALNSGQRTLLPIRKLIKLHHPLRQSVNQINLNHGQQHQATADKETHFGYQSVKESEKEQKVHKVFEEVAKSYDVMNDAMSLGIHRVWKDVFMQRLGPTHGTKLLDMAGGTGDIAFRYIKYLQSLPRPQAAAAPQPLGHVTISDINQNMLDVGKARAEKQGFDGNVRLDWVCANAEQLPFADDTFTAYTIAFGIRNCTHIDRVLSEAHRVLRPGGRFMCLEFSHLNNATLQWYVFSLLLLLFHATYLVHSATRRLYDQYSFTVIPPMGQVLAGQWQPYQYLVESIRRFPRQEQFRDMIEAAGFSCAQYEDLTMGVCSIHSGFKL